MSNGKSGRRPQLSTTLAGAALFAALGGSAFAAGLIDGGDIEKGTVASKQIKNETVKVKDLNNKTVAALKGAKGETGPQGPQGIQGVQGPAGIVAPQTASLGSENLAAGVEEVVLAKSVPEATYVINAKLTNFAAAGVTQSECTLTAGPGGSDDRTQTDALGRTPMALQAVSVASPADPIEVSCQVTGGSGSASDVKITAIPVS